MKFQVKKYIIAMLITMGVVIGLSPYLVARADVNPVVSIDTDGNSVEKENINRTIKDINSSLQEEVFSDDVEFLQLESSYADVFEITINMIEYNKLNDDNKFKVLDKTLNAIKDSKISVSNRNKFYNYVAKLDESVSSIVKKLSTDTRMDLGFAYHSLGGIFNFISKYFGLFVILIFWALTISLVVDIAYLTIPFVQWFLALFVFKKSKIVDGQAKPLFISMEAFHAHLDAERETKYVNMLGRYFSRRSKQLIILFICIIYMVSGEIYALFANIIDLFKNAVTG